MFVYPKFNKKGNKKIISRTKGKTSEMLMDIDIHKLKDGQSIKVFNAEMETAILLVEGSITYFYDGKKEFAERKNMFRDAPVCLHIPRGVKVTVKSHCDSEVLTQSTHNEAIFPIKLYRKEDLDFFVSCEGRWENTAVRDVVTIFDYDNAPYSNMVLGEVYARQGRWWSYIPHSHPQPEVYYYKFEREEGFGACFIGEKSYTIKEGSAGLFEGGFTHAQVTAPGYPMYCCWMIRHLPNDPWIKTRTDDPRYSWLLD